MHSRGGNLPSYDSFQFQQSSGMDPNTISLRQNYEIANSAFPFPLSHLLGSSGLKLLPWLPEAWLGCIT